MNNFLSDIKSPNELLLMIFDKIEKNSSFLDLGCGRGGDSIFMTKNGFKVTAVDRSNEVINNLNNLALKNNLSINTYCQNILDFNMKEGEYLIINIINVLHFLKKKWAIKIIEDAKNNLKKGGYIVITNFTVDDPGYLEHQEGGYFEKDELKNLFLDFEIIYYNESLIIDKGHPGKETPHQHYLAKLIGKKK